MKQKFLLLAGLCVIAGQAHAGLFDDEVARNHIRQLDERATKLEEAAKQQSEATRQQTESNIKLIEASKQLEEAGKQQTRSMLDLQAQIEAQNTELRNLRGQNEELRHLLQDAEKRQKDFYIDLDTRIRNLESAEATRAAAPPPSAIPQEKTETPPLATDEVAAGNRAYEAAYSLFKAGDHQKAVSAYQEFLKKFPESVYIPQASYELGSAHFALKDYKDALASYQLVTGKYSFSPKAQDAMLGVAECQIELKELSAAKKTFKQIMAKHPGSEIAGKAKERLATLK
ncbi:MAG: tol-pal system protein YbgF [Gallionellaceae bacterium]|nr:tol-pal system protein YbgF [Gallionellaceae bacterium]